MTAFSFSTFSVIILHVFKRKNEDELWREGRFEVKALKHLVPQLISVNIVALWMDIKSFN